MRPVCIWYYHNDEGWFFAVDGGPVWGCYSTYLEAVEQAFMYILND